MSLRSAEMHKKFTDTDTNLVLFIMKPEQKASPQSMLPLISTEFFSFYVRSIVFD